MAKSYRVTAEYVTLKVKDQAGADVLIGYYKGGVVSNEIEKASLKHHLDGDMLEEVEDEASEPEAPEPEAPKEPTVKEILDEVGDDKEKAQTALDAEKAKETPRSSLTDKLEAILGKA